MAKLILLLAIACFQFSQQKELSETEKFSDEVLSAIKDTSNSELASNEEGNKYDEKWTKEDEKWLQEIQSLLEDSDEDYFDDYEEIVKLVMDVEIWIRKSHPEKGWFRWFFDIKKLIENLPPDWDLKSYHYLDYVKKEKNIKIAVDENDNLDLYYSWLYQTKLKNPENEKVQLTKRFSSV